MVRGRARHATVDSRLKPGTFRPAMLRMGRLTMGTALGWLCRRLARFLGRPPHIRAAGPVTRLDRRLASGSLLGIFYVLLSLTLMYTQPLWTDRTDWTTQGIQPLMAPPHWTSLRTDWTRLLQCNSQSIPTFLQASKPLYTVELSSGISFSSGSMTPMAGNNYLLGR
jgi:hypothetical protein